MYEFRGLVPELRPFAELLLEAARQGQVAPLVTSVRRSHAEQVRLYRRYVNGLSSYPAAPPGYSPHEYGLAFDLDCDPHEALAQLGALWESWGGTWGGSRDPIHFEAPGASQALRDRGQYP